jgi:hypothetical protein
MTSVSQWTCRYVWLHAIPTMPKAREQPPASAACTGCGGEEKDEGSTGRAGVGGVARRERGAEGVNEPIQRARAIDK